MAGLGRAALVLAFALLFTLVGIVSSQAGSVTVRGAEMNRFARIELVFERPVKVTARVSNGILVLGFGEAAAVRGERLGLELPAYVSNVRPDPDGTGLRVALNANYRPNVLEAGERVFVDLLPESWTGLPPGLPPDVVAELVRRAREAETRAGVEEARRRTQAPQPVAVHVAVLPTLTRVVFEPPALVPVDFKAEGDRVELRFDGPLTLDTSEARARLLGQVRSLTGETVGGALVVSLRLEPGRTARGFREDETFVVDIERPAPAPEPPRAPAPAFSAGAAREAARPAPAKPPEPAPARGSEPKGPEPKAPEARSAELKPAEPRPAERKPAAASATLTPEGLKIVLPFRTRTAAAAFERAGTVTAVFHGAEPLALPVLPEGAERLVGAPEVTREGAFAVLRLPLAGPAMVRMSPTDDGWALTVGRDAVAPAEPVPAGRSVDENGRTVLVVPVRDASGVHWLEGGPERIAVVTAFAPARGTAKPQRFAELEMLPTAHGFAVRALADDVTVRSGLDGIAIARGAGLALTLPGAEPRPEGAAPADLLFDRARWDADRAGPVRERYRAKLDAVARAARSDRTPLRLDLARFLVAQGLSHEAGGVLAYAAHEEPRVAETRDFALLQGAAAVRAHRHAEGRRLLERPDLADHPEALLWRGLLDGRTARWGAALAHFRRAAAVLDAYPDELQVPFRLMAARAAIEMRDTGFADGELAMLRGLEGPAEARQEAELLRARLDEAVGRKEVAVSVYGRLAESAERPVAAEATLRWVDLALREGLMDPAEAAARYETLAVTWRGDAIEAATLGRLGRLYAEAGRWREAFTTARQANLVFPDHEVTRALHDDTARLFDELFLSGRGESLSRLETLGLFFDFKDFLPIGRRGDEIVRRLADRLVELDLLDQAGDLLQHQVENRLTGAARATVAARLATIRLMDGKPAQALAALQSTRLPELPRSVRRARLLLEARALSDLSRTDLALEVLADERGPEIDRLRADIHWTGRRWREAGEAHEALAGTRWQGPAALSERDRTDVMRAAIAYALADDAIALDRLRTKFAPKMADSDDARAFGVLARPGAATTAAFRDIARRVTSADTLADFLSEYRRRYPDAAATERPRKAPEAEARPQVQGAVAGAPRG